MTAEPAKRRGRPRKQQSFAEWMLAVDAEVSAMVKKVEKEPPMYTHLGPSQKRLVEMLIAHLKTLPRLGDSERVYDKKEYGCVNTILCALFLAKYPNWTERSSDGRHAVDKLPNGEGKTFEWILRGCAGGTGPMEPVHQDDDDEDDDD